MKKRIFPVFLTIILHADLKCQITKNTWLLGGSVSYTSMNYKSEATSQLKASEFQGAPQIGYFIADKASTGIKATFLKSGFKTGATSKSTSTDFNIGPFIRYYLLPGDRYLNLLFEAAYQYGFSKGNSSRKNTKGLFTIAAGPVIFFNNTIGLECLAVYATSKYHEFVGINQSIRFSIGLLAHLEKE